jgi:hypothetical protein
MPEAKDATPAPAPAPPVEKSKSALFPRLKRSRLSGLFGFLD